MNDNLLQWYNRHIKHALSLFIEEAKGFFKPSRWEFYGTVVAMSGIFLVGFWSILNANLSDRRSYISVIGEVASEFSIIMSSFLAFMIGLIAENLHITLGLLVFLMAIRGKEKAIWSKEKRRDVFVFVMVFWGILVLHKLPITLRMEYLPELAFTVAGIIGASIAIIFSFSVLILQTTSKLLSPEYSSLLAREGANNRIFWSLALLSIISCLIPFGSNITASDVNDLLMILWLAFYLVFEMYTELKNNMNLENVLDKIQDVAFEEMENEFKVAISSPYARSKSPSDKKRMEDRFDVGIEHAENLQEIALILSAKNEVRNCTLTLLCICNLYIKLLKLEYRHFNKIGKNVSKDFLYLRLLRKITQNLQLIGEHFIREGKTDNITSLLYIYRTILISILEGNYEKDSSDADGSKDSLSFSFVFSEYSNLVKNLMNSEKVGDETKSILMFNRLFVDVLKKEGKYFSICSAFCSSEMHEITRSVTSENFPIKFRDNYLTALVESYFEQIKVGWRIRSTTPMWSDLFEGLEACISSLDMDSSLSPNPNMNFSHINGEFSDFHSWQHETLSSILESECEEKQNESLSESLGVFIFLLERLGEAFNSFSSNHGLNSKQGGLIIKSVGVNLDLIHKLAEKFKEMHVRPRIHDIYTAHINVLASYSNNADKSKFDLEKTNSVLKILSEVIKYNLEYGGDINLLITQYIELEAWRFKNMPDDSRAKVIDSLDVLSVLMEQHGKDAEKQMILSKIEKLKNSPPHSGGKKLQLVAR